MSLQKKIGYKREGKSIGFMMRWNFGGKVDYKYESET